MSESYVHLPVDTNNTGKFVRATLKTVNGVDVLEHFQEISDPIDNKTARVRDSSPLSEDAGAVVRSTAADAIAATNQQMLEVMLRLEEYLYQKLG